MFTDILHQAFHSLGVGKGVLISVITLITGVETIKRQTMAAYGCLVAGQSHVDAGLSHGLYRLYARSVCDNRAAAAAVAACSAI